VNDNVSVNCKIQGCSC